VKFGCESASSIGERKDPEGSVLKLIWLGPD